MSVSMKRYQYVLESIPCYPDSISSLELNEKLLSKDLGNAELSQSSQLRTTQRAIDKALAEHTSIEILDENRPYRYQIAKGHPHPINPGGMSSVVSLQLLEHEIGSMLPPTLRSDVKNIFGALDSTQDRRISLWKERFCYLPIEFQLQPPQIDESYIELIEQALLSKKDLILHYTKRGSVTPARYKVTPLGIVLHGNSFYLIAFKNDAEQYRTFAIHRIASLALGFSTLRPLEHFDIKTHALTQIPHFSGGEWVEVLLRVKNYQGMHIIEETPLCEGQQVLSTDQDYTRIKARVRDSLGFQWWVMKHSNFIEVLEPMIIREAIIESIKDANRLYGIVTK